MSQRLPGRSCRLTRDRRNHDRWMHRDRFALQALKRKVAAMFLAMPDRDGTLRDLALIDLSLKEGKHPVVEEAWFALEEAIPGLRTLREAEELHDLLSRLEFYSTEPPVDFLEKHERYLRQSAKYIGVRVGDWVNEVIAEYAITHSFPECYRDGPRARGERRAVFLEHLA